MTSGRYNAQACGPGCEDALVSGVLWITEHGASFQGDTASFTLPMEGLRIDRAGATGDTIRLTNPAHPGWFISTTDLSITTDRMLISRGDMRSVAKSGKRRTCCCLTGCLSVILVAVALVVALVLSKDAIVSALAKHFPQEWEQQIGNGLIAATVPEGSRLTDPELRAGIEAIAQPIFAAIPQEEGFTSFTLHLSGDPEPNAFAMPGGHIVVNAGLIALADSPEEVAGVLAHEAAHATLRHGLQSIISRVGTVALLNLVVGDVEGLTAVVVEGSDFLLNQKYSRDFERQADDKAWEYLNRANINPTGLVSFFEKLETLQGGAAQPAILSTHPATKERIDALEARLKEAGAGTGKDGAWRVFDLDYARYKAAVATRGGQ